MTQLSEQQINSLRTLADTGDIGGVYKQMSEFGVGYGELALDVYSGQGFGGIYANNLLTLGDSLNLSLMSDVEFDAFRKKLAEAAIDTVESFGTYLPAAEIDRFHEEIFAKYQLPWFSYGGANYGDLFGQEALENYYNTGEITFDLPDELDWGLIADLYEGQYVNFPIAIGSLSEWGFIEFGDWWESEFGDGFWDWSSGARDGFWPGSNSPDAEVIIGPIGIEGYGEPVILDLDGDGIELVNIEDSQAFYDLDGDGFKENVGWTSSDDAILAIDVDGDGEIEKAEEVNFTLHHEDAETDLDGVRLAFDSNQDGILDSNDDRFSDFRVWQDLDGDGTADEGELKTLAEAGIKSIGLEAERNDQNIDGNILHRTTELTFDDGSHSTVGDVSFKLSDFGLRNEDNGSTTIKIDENSQILLGTSTDDVLTAPEQNTILMGGTGNDTLQGGRGDDWLFGGEGGDDLLGGEGDDIFYADGQDTISGGDGFDTILFSGTEGVEFDLTSHGIEAAIGSDGNDKLISSAGASAILSGGNGADLLAGSWNGDLLTGGSGNDTLKGNAGDDTYVFGRGDGLDTIEDRWDGAAAFDYLQELYGDDSFDGHFFALRYHEDLMQTNAGNDTLILGEGIAPEDLLFRVQGTDLVIALKNADGTVSEFANTTDRLTIKDWDSEASQIENIEFSNGTSLNLKNFLNDLGLQTDGTVLNTEQAISAKLQEIEKNIELERALWSGSSDRDIVIADPVASFIETGSGEDILFGSAESDLLLAGDDSDLIFAGGGHDWIDAGHGIDFVDAGDGDDTIIGRGDGDVIDGGAGSDLLDYGQSDDGVRLDMSDTKGYEADHLEDRAQDIEAVTGSGFNDDLAGSALNETFEAGAGDDTVSGRLGDDELSGGAGDDTLLGQQGDDVLHGGSGDDILSGGSGDDTLYGGEGNNLLFGGEGDDEAVFAGSRDDYDFVRDGDDLIVIGAEGETRLSDIETIRFDDEVFNVEELLADEDIPVTTENRQRRDEQYQTALAASVASAVALGGLASTYDNTAQAAERIEASADTGDGDTADVWIVEPVSSGDAKDPFVAGASDGDLLTGSGSESDENLNIAQLGVDMSGETGASNSHSVIAGETVSDSGNEIETMPEMIGTIVSDPSEELPVPENAAENPDDAEEAQATANDDASEIIPPNLAPIVTADFAHTLEDQEIRVKIADLLANDFDPERMRLEFVSLGSVSGGSVRIDGGYLVFSPDPDFHGDALISYSLRDSHNNIVPSRLTIAVTEVNDIPVVTGERVSGNEDTVLRLSIAELLANDSDMDGDSLSLSSLVGVEHGTAEIDGDDILFTPDANHNGEAVLRYAVSDGRGGQTIGTVRIDIAAVNDTPEPVDDIAATNEDQAIELLIADLLSNDEDIEGDSLSLSAITSVTGGTAVISGGKVIFRPDADFHGEASFTYRVEDGQGGVSEATTRIAVAEVNDIPLVTGERVSGREDTVLRLSIADLLVNDSDADGDSLNLSSLVGVEHGTAEIDGNDILFTPDANHNGEAVLRYAVSDGRGGQTVGTVRIDVAAVNDAPVAGDDTRSSLEDNTLSIRFAELLSNDSDVDGDTLSITGIVSTQYGNAVIENDQILFTPDEDFNGTASVVYRLSDGNGGISTGVVSINVLAVNDASVAVDDWFSTNEDRSISISSESLLSNDYDSDDDTPAVTGVSDPVGGSVTLDNGNITFLPSANFNGNASFKYQIDDGNGGTAEATVTVQVIAVNDAPDLVDDTAATDEDQAIELAITDLLANDSDIEGDSLSLTAITSVAGGTATIEDGKVIFRPDADFHGEASFTYRVEDGQGGISEATTRIAVTEVNDAPVVTGERVPGREDTVLRLSIADLLANDSDVDGDLLSLTSLVGFEHGTAEIDGDDILFTPDANYNGEAILRYAVSDGRGGQTIGTVRIDVAAVNDAPDLVDDTAATDEDQAIELSIADLLANDSDVEGDSLSLTAITSVTGGTATIEDGKVIFRPDADFHGEASFTYRVEDGQGGISEATTRITVTEINDAPVVTGERVSGREDTVLRLSIADLLANDSDVDGDLLSLTTLVGFEHGTAELDGDDILFTPDANYNGEAILRYAVSDGRGGQTIGTVRIDVAAVNDAPDLQDDVLQTDEDQALQLNVADLLANDSDREGDTLAVIGVEAFSGGTVNLSGDTITFTPDADFNGIARFKYQVDDGNGGVSTAFADITVTAVNDAPAIEVIADTRTHYHQALALTALVSASDIDGDALYIELRDAANLGHFEVDGQAVPDQSIVRVLLSEIDRVRFVPVAYPDSVETLQIRAFDGEIYTDWKPLAVTADNTVLGTEGADELMAGDIGDILDSFAGNDTLTGGLGDDLLLGRDGDDILLGGTGNDTLYGGEGDDTIVAGAGNNSIWAGNGNDRIEISNLDDLTRLDAGDGRDRLVLQTDEDVTLDISTVYAEEIEAGAGNDVLYSNGAEDLYIHAGDGDDVLLGGDGNDTLIGGDGKDRIEGGAGDDVIEIGLGDNLADIDGGSGNDTLMVSDGVDITIDMTGTGIENVVGGTGKETVTDLALEGSSVSLGAGDDTVVAGSGADILEGDSGSDTLDYGQSTGGININLAENSVSGGTGDGDTISGFENVNDTAFDDVIVGDAEDNRLLSSSGNDDLTGGDGADEFVINLDPSATGTVRIRDFSPINGDMLSLTGLGAAGTIAAITNALASQTMNEDGDVTLSFADGRSVIFEGLGEPFTAEMTSAPVLSFSNTIAHEETGEFKSEISLSRPLNEDITFAWKVEDGIVGRAAEDFSTQSGALIFPKGQTRAAISVDLDNEDGLESVEDFRFVISDLNQNDASTSISQKIFLADDGSSGSQINPEEIGVISSITVKEKLDINFRYDFDYINLHIPSNEVDEEIIGQYVDFYDIYAEHPLFNIYGGPIATSALTIDMTDVESFSFDIDIHADTSGMQFVFSDLFYSQNGVNPFHLTEGKHSSWYDFSGGMWTSQDYIYLQDGHPFSLYGYNDSYKINTTFTINELANQYPLSGFYDLYFSLFGWDMNILPDEDLFAKNLYIEVSNFYVTRTDSVSAYKAGDVNQDNISDFLFYDYEKKCYVFRGENQSGEYTDYFSIYHDIGQKKPIISSTSTGSSLQISLVADGNSIRIIDLLDLSTNTNWDSFQEILFEQNVTSIMVDSEASNEKYIFGLGNDDFINEIIISSTSSGETLSQSHIDGSTKIILPNSTYTGVISLGDLNDTGTTTYALVSSEGVKVIPDAILSAKQGARIVLGEAVDDILTVDGSANLWAGLEGNDEYQINTGTGEISIVNQGSAVADHDRIIFEDGISAEQLWFTRNGNDLLLEVLGTDDSVTVADWYGGDLSAKIDAIALQDGSELAGYEIEKIVSLMAAIDKPEDSGTATETLANAGLTDDVEELWVAG